MSNYSASSTLTTESNAYHDSNISNVNSVHLGNVYHVARPHQDLAVATLVDDLFLTEPSCDLADIVRLNGKRVAGTCEWLLKLDEYRRWAADDDDRDRLLWLLGPPGIGKTTISSFLVETLGQEEARYPSTILAYYFCDGRDENRRTALSVVRGLLVQLLRRQPGLFQLVEDDYRLHGMSISRNLSALTRALRRILGSCDGTRVYILIDAIDECEGSSRQDLLSLIDDLNAHSRARVVVTSRPEPDVETAAECAGESFRVGSAEVSADLSAFIHFKVEELRRRKRNYPAKLIKDIRDTLQQKAAGTFLWAALVLADVGSAPTALLARKRLERLPGGLSRAYRGMLEGIDAEALKSAQFILQWAVTSQRPMTPRELAAAQALGTEGWGGDSMPPPDVLDELMDGHKACGPLLYYDPKSDAVALIHPSAGDYLTSADCPRQYRVDAEEARLWISRIRPKYLALREAYPGNGAAAPDRSALNRLAIRHNEDTSKRIRGASPSAGHPQDLRKSGRDGRLSSMVASVRRH